MTKNRTSLKMTTALDDLEMLDGDTVAGLLKISTKTLKRMYHAKQIPGIMVGGRLRFPLSEVRKYIAEGLAHQSTTPPSAWRHPQQI